MCEAGGLRFSFQSYPGKTLFAGEKRRVEIWSAEARGVGPDRRGACAPLRPSGAFTPCSERAF